MKANKHIDNTIFWYEFPFSYTFTYEDLIGWISFIPGEISSNYPVSKDIYYTGAFVFGGGVRPQTGISMLFSVSYPFFAMNYENFHSSFNISIVLGYNF